MTSEKKLKRTIVKKEVAMDDLAFTSKSHVTLVTLGVCTCIAFTIQGSYWNDELDEKIDFCGLYHWSGFNVIPSDHDQQTQSVFNYFLYTLRSTLKLNQTHPIEINSLQFIGGEKAQYDNNNKLLLTGTEAEVRSLTKTVQEYDFKKNHFILDPQNISHQHFLTSNDQSIQITLTTKQCDFIINEADVENNESASPAKRIAL